MVAVNRWREEHSTLHACPECRKLHKSIYTICNKCWNKWVIEGKAHPTEYGAV